MRKSVGAENTFSDDLTEFDAMIAALQPLVDKVWQHCANTGNRGRTVTLKVKYADFEIMSRSQSMHSRIKPRRARTGRGITSRTLDATAESSAAARCVAIDTSDEGGRRAIPVPITNLAALGRFSPSVSDRLAQRARQKLNRIRLLDEFKACMGVFG